MQTGDIHETVKRLLAVNLYRLVCHEPRSLTEECIKVVTKLRKSGTSITTSDLQFWREHAGTDLAKIAIETERTGTPLATFPSMRASHNKTSLQHILTHTKPAPNIVCDFTLGFLAKMVNRQDTILRKHIVVYDFAQSHV